MLYAGCPMGKSSFTTLHARSAERKIFLSCKMVLPVPFLLPTHMSLRLWQPPGQEDGFLPHWGGE